MENTELEKKGHENHSIAMKESLLGSIIFSFTLGGAFPDDGLGQLIGVAPREGQHLDYLGSPFPLAPFMGLGMNGNWAMASLFGLSSGFQISP